MCVSRTCLRGTDPRFARLVKAGCFVAEALSQAIEYRQHADRAYVALPETAVAIAQGQSRMVPPDASLASVWRRGQPGTRKRVRTAAMKRRTRTRPCFLSAPFGLDTRLLEAELRKRGFSISDGRTLKPGTPLVDEVRKKISQADLVCVVAPSTLSLNAAFELGLAVGTAKRALVFAPLGTLMPTDLAGITYSSARLDDKKAIGSFLDAFLEYGRSRPVQGQAPSEPHRLPHSESKRLRGALGRASGLKFEQLVKELFEASGYIASEPTDTQEGGVDFAVWADHLHHSFGNPILVQVKDRVRGPLSSDTAAVLRSALDRTRGRLGLLIYRKADPKLRQALVSTSWPLVMCLEVRELLSLLENGQLESRLIDIRNRAAHGIGNS